MILKFAGYANERTSIKKTQEMAEWLKQNQMASKAGFMISQYNPPWIIDPFKKYELMAQTGTEERQGEAKASH